jgi:hypothetical protein
VGSAKADGGKTRNMRRVIGDQRIFQSRAGFFGSGIVFVED